MVILIHVTEEVTFELTNQDSAGEKKCTVLTSMFVNRKGIEVEQLSHQSQRGH